MLVTSDSSIGTRLTESELLEDPDGEGTFLFMIAVLRAGYETGITGVELLSSVLSGIAVSFLSGKASSTGLVYLNPLYLAPL